MTTNAESHRFARPFKGAMMPFYEVIIHEPMKNPD